MDVAELHATEVDPFGGPWLFGSEWVDFNAVIDKHNVDFENVAIGGVTVAASANLQPTSITAVGVVDYSPSRTIGLPTSEIETISEFNSHVPHPACNPGADQLVSRTRMRGCAKGTGASRDSGAQVPGEFADRRGSQSDGG